MRDFRLQWSLVHALYVNLGPLPKGKLGKREKIKNRHWYITMVLKKKSKSQKTYKREFFAGFFMKIDGSLSLLK